MDKANKMDSKHLPLRFKAQKLRIQLNVTLTSVIELHLKKLSGNENQDQQTQGFLRKGLPLLYSVKTKTFEYGNKVNIVSYIIFC